MHTVQQQNARIDWISSLSSESTRKRRTGHAATRPVLAAYWGNIYQRRSRVRGRAILCSKRAEQRHSIIRNRVALVGEESVSGHTRSANSIDRGVSLQKPVICRGDDLIIDRAGLQSGGSGEGLSEAPQFFLVGQAG